MAICYLLPGFAGSSLFTRYGMIWLNYSELILGRFGQMELAADGILPGGADGIPCYPEAGSGLATFQGMVPGYYETLYECLNYNLTGVGYTITPYPYDWRLRSATNASRLGRQILASVTAADPCTIVGHSAGGLLALNCWKWLAAIGRSNLIRRIVTLGTPFYGSYHAVREASAEDGTTTFWIQASNVFFAITRPIRFPILFARTWSQDEVVLWLMTFPGYYELLPYFEWPIDPIIDVNRGQIYTAGFWREDARPPQSYLDYARQTFQPAMMGRLDDMPPSNVLVCAAGYGLPTPVGLISGEDLNQRRNYTYTTDGDDTVLVASAAPAGYSSHLLPTSHALIPTASTYGLAIISWILDPYSTPAPTAPIPVPAGTPGYYGSGLPYPQSQASIPTSIPPPVGGIDRRRNPCCP